MNTYNVKKRLLSLLTLGAGILLMLIHPAMAADEQRADVKTIHVNDYDMSYVERGSGAPLVLVHGSLSDYRTWLPLLDDLSENNRTIAVSLRHYYPEQWDGKGSDLSLQQHADDMAAFIQALNIGPVYLLGHSRGAAVALLTASNHPELVHRLILADPSPLSSMLPDQPDIQADEKDRRAKIHDIMKYYQQGDTEGGLRVFVNYVAGPTAWDNTPESIRDVLRSNSWTLTSMPRDIETPFSCSNAANISAPVLLITGDRSARRYGSMHSALKPCLKQVSNTTIGDAGHMMFQSNPTEFAFAVQYFISPE